MDLFEYDQSVKKSCPVGGPVVLAGVDEAGRGPLAGPVVAAAVILPEGLRIEGVRDSKKVPERLRERLFLEISAKASAVGVGIVEAGEIDRINILVATKLAMRKAISALAVTPNLILIDALTLPDVPVRQVPIIKGDARSASIAAASIIAKVTRDRLMLDYHKAYPEYGFDRHKGYGTGSHIARINEFGPCPIHRMTFRKVISVPLSL